MPTISTVRRAVATVAAGAAITCVTGIAGTAPADATVPHHGKVYFVVTSTSKSAVALMHGALNAVGTDPDTNSDTYDVLHFAGGTIRLTHPQKDGKFVPYVNKKTCFASFRETGTFTVGHGTGRYAGISGSGSYSGHGDFFLKRTKSGACDQKGAPSGGVFAIYAHATLK